MDYFGTVLFYCYNYSLKTYRTGVVFGGRSVHLWHLHVFNFKRTIFTDQVLVYECVLAVVFHMQHSNLLCEKCVFFVFFLSSSLTSGQKANFSVFSVLSIDNKVSYVLICSGHTWVHQ